MEWPNDDMANNTMNNMYKILIINNIPILLDTSIYRVIKKMNINWRINPQNLVIGTYRRHDTDKSFTMHQLVMIIASKIFPDRYTLKKLPILHINRINFDNRIANLVYNTDSTLKTTKKKRRIIDLSKKGVDSSTLPTYIWYMKADQTHGERFFVNIKNIVSWKSSSSNALSLRYKLEESKLFLRKLLKEKRDSFSQSMNGDLSSVGYQLYEEYEAIIQSIGYSMNHPLNNTYNFLKPDYKGLTVDEIELLEKLI